MKKRKRKLHEILRRSRKRPVGEVKEKKSPPTLSDITEEEDDD